MAQILISCPVALVVYVSPLDSLPGSGLVTQISEALPLFGAPLFGAGGSSPHAQHSQAELGNEPYTTDAIGHDMTYKLQTQIKKEKTRVKGKGKRNLLLFPFPYLKIANERAD
ncbi:MAG TPA: hypothetical protein DCY88_29020 [Cyanobacteria bacterium UBA11372]|nr:hypothetical protein [Cyanobacteria bacterium UBA11372]